MFTRKVVPFLVFALLMSWVISFSQAQNETEYSLQIKLNLSCSIPFQSVSPVIVTVELRNLGNETFNGNITISGSAKGISYGPEQISIKNLTQNSVQTITRAYRTDVDGTYSFEIHIEAFPLSRIKLYRDSTVVSEGYRVDISDSILLHSFTDFITIIGIIVGAMVALVTAYFLRRKPEEKAILRITPLLSTPAITGNLGLDIWVENIGYSIAKDIEVKCQIVPNNSIPLENNGIFKHSLLAPRDPPIKYSAINLVESPRLLSQQKLIIETSYSNKDDKKQKPIKMEVLISELRSNLYRRSTP